jgi:hypothetical protein
MSCSSRRYCSSNIGDVAAGEGEGADACRTPDIRLVGLASSAYPAAGTIRGGAKLKDWYYFTGITLSIAINNSKSFFGNGNRKSQTDCPKVL